MIVHYQPIVDIDTLEVVRVESFCRIPAARLDLGTPAAYLASVERSGEIRNFTQWMLETVLVDRGAGDYTLPVSINLAFANLFESDLVSRVRALLEAHGVEPSDVTFELSDGIQQIDGGYGLDTMRQLAIDGVRFAIDGFASNFANVADLEVMRLPVQELKIDARLIELPTFFETGGSARLKEFADEEGLTLVAKCVETNEQLAAARELGCRYAQGYLFSEPLSAADFGVWLRRDAPGASSLRTETHDEPEHLVEREADSEQGVASI